MQLIAILVLTFFIVGCSRNEVPIVKAIGLTPVLDETRNAGPDVDRELVFENKHEDPDFYRNIVARVERCPSTKGFRKEIGKNQGNFILKKSHFKASDIIESTTFFSPNNEFICVISNGQTFVLVYLSAS